MQNGFIQIFDKKDDALEALGGMQTILPDLVHHLVEKCQQIQVLTRIKGAETATVHGVPNPEVVYLVTSLPK